MVADLADLDPVARLELCHEIALELERRAAGIDHHGYADVVSARISDCISPLFPAVLRMSDAELRQMLIVSVS
jgi:hypothetical protein